MPGVTRPATRADVLATLAIVLVVVSVVAGRAVLRGLAPRPSPDECAALLDRYVELVLRTATPEPAAAQIADHACLADAGADGDAADLAQGIGHQSRGAHFLKGKLRVLMDVTPQADQLIRKRLGFLKHLKSPSS